MKFALDALFLQRSNCYLVAVTGRLFYARHGAGC